MAVNYYTRIVCFAPPSLSESGRFAALNQSCEWSKAVKSAALEVASSSPF